MFKCSVTESSQWNYCCRQTRTCSHKDAVMFSHFNRTPSSDRQTDRQTDTRRDQSSRGKNAPHPASHRVLSLRQLWSVKLLKSAHFGSIIQKIIINSFFATQCARYYVGRQLLCKNLSKSDIRTWISISTAKPANCTPISFKTTAAIWLRCIGSVNRTMLESNALGLQATWINQTFTVTSEHTRFYFLVFFSVLHF